MQDGRSWDSKFMIGGVEGKRVSTLRKDLEVRKAWLSEVMT